MKIAFFTDTFYPEVNGVAASCLTLKRALEKRGHEVHVFAPRSRVKDAVQDPRVHLLPSMPFFLLKDRNVTFYSGNALRRMAAMGFDVVHTHSEFAAGILGLRVGLAGGAALVHTYHTAWEDYTTYVSHGVKPVDKAVKGFSRKYSRWWCNRFDRVVTPTAKTRDLLIGYGERTDIDIIPSGMDLGRFAPERHPASEREAIRLECGVKPGERVLLNIGRLAPEKNLSRLLRVFPDLLKVHPEVRFVIIGEGPSRKELAEEAGRLGVGNSVTLTGPKPWDDIDKYYAIGDVFASCSHSETQGLTYIEAMASGLCVTAARDACLDGVLEDGVNGLLAEDTKESLLAALCRAFGDEGEAIRTRAPESVRRYGTQAFAEAIERCYEQAMLASARREHSMVKASGKKLAAIYHSSSRAIHRSSAKWKKRYLHTRFRPKK